MTRLKLSGSLSRIGFTLMGVVVAEFLSLLGWGISKGVWQFGPKSLLPGYPGNDLGMAETAPYMFFGFACFAIGGAFVEVSLRLMPRRSEATLA